MIKHVLWIALAAMLSGCGDGGSANAVGGVTQREADALNNAAEMLDQTTPPPNLGIQAAPTTSATPDKLPAKAK